MLRQLAPPARCVLARVRAGGFAPWGCAPAVSSLTLPSGRCLPHGLLSACAECRLICAPTFHFVGLLM
eukprot:14543836-Alexandrium_andersonii.AAC.1